MILTVQLLSSSVNVPMSAPCCDSQPAQGLPACSAVKRAAVADALMPDASGFATNSSAGFVSFSKTAQVHAVPSARPPCSLLRGSRRGRGKSCQ
jgi:hypothetical protein